MTELAVRQVKYSFTDIHGRVVIIVAVVAKVVVAAVDGAITSWVKVKHNGFYPFVVAEMQSGWKTLLLILTEVWSLAGKILHHVIFHL